MAALVIFAFKIIPMFDEIYKSLGTSGDLPLLTQCVISSSGFIKKEFLLIASGIALIAFLVKQVVTTSSGRRAYEKIFFSAPILGDLCTALVVEKFSTTIQVLLKSGIPVIRALEMAANTAGNNLFAEKIEEAKAKVMAGLPLGDALQHTGLFPPIAISFIMVAEKTGNYSGMFEEIAKYHKDIIETTMIRVIALMEPVMLVVMAIVIGAIVIAMFLPIFRLATAGGA
jgi:type IV pilus assembly protein PilC